MPTIKMARRAGNTSGRGLLITHRHDLYTVSVSGKQLTKFLREVLLTKPEGFEGKREFNRGYLDSNYYYMPIRRIELEPYRGTVYNLEVEEHSSYVGSFVVHNSAGVNLPARRVVVADLARYDGSIGMNSAISVLDYRQMAARAGRPQYDDYGETVMVPSSSLNPTDVLEHYALGEVEPMESKLGEDRGMRVHLLAAIATSLGVTRLDIDALFSKTLLAAQVGKEKVQRA